MRASRSQIENDFWTEKLEAYRQNSEVYETYHVKESQKINEDSDMENLYKLLVEKFGTNYLYKNIREATYRKKEYNIWCIRFYPQGNKQGSNNDYIEISNSCVSHQYVTCFLISINNDIRRYWCNSYRYQEIFNLFCNFYNDYESNKNELTNLLLEYEKNEKIKTVAQQSIKAIVEAKMTGTGYKWDLQEEGSRCVLRIKMKRGKMIELTLGYKSFTEKIPEMLEVIKQMENLLDTIPYPVNVRSCAKNIDWKES